MMQVMVLPPIMYESAVNVEKRGKIIHRLGTILLSQLFTVMLFMPCYLGLALMFGLTFTDYNFVFLLALIT
jgi:hypothetical protein